MKHGHRYQLDGFEDNDGAVFMARTNDLEAIDPAIRQRPSRFDVVVHLRLPSREARRAIIERNLPHGSACGTLLDEEAVATDGLSGAQVREVAYLALQRAILRDACDCERLVMPQAEDIVYAAKHVVGTHGEPIGFRAE